MLVVSELLDSCRRKAAVDERRYKSPGDSSFFQPKMEPLPIPYISTKLTLNYLRVDVKQYLKLLRLHRRPVVSCSHPEWTYYVSMSTCQENC
jgi:hypothetical protein